MRTSVKPNRSVYILALASGLLLAAAFPKIDQGWVAWIALVPLLLALRQVRPRVGFGIGMVAGLVYNLGVIYWTAYTMHVYGHLPKVQSVLVLLLFAVFLALFIAVFAMVLCRVCRRPWQLVLLAPAAWAALEWVRSWIFTGFPWALLGHSQYDRLWVIQIADLFGVYGVSALIVAFNALIVLALLHWAEKPWGAHMVERAIPVRAGIAVAAAMVVTRGMGSIASRVWIDGRQVPRMPWWRWCKVMWTNP